MTNKPMLSVELLPCPFCGSAASLEDHRLVWCVRCTKCSACVLGDRAPEPHGDGVSIDEVQDAQAAAMVENTDWAAYEKSAVDAWNLWSESVTKKHSEPVAWEACGQLFKTIMGARNHAGSMPIFPLFKSSPIGVDMVAACDEMRRSLRSREALIDELREKIAEQPVPVAAIITDEQILEVMRQAMMSADGGYVFDTAKQDVIEAGRALIAEVARLNGVKP